MGKIGQLRPGLAKEIGARDPVLVAELTLRPGETAKAFQITNRWTVFRR